MANRVGQYFWQQIAYGETICAGVAFLLQSRPEGRSRRHAPPVQSHTPDARTCLCRLPVPLAVPRTLVDDPGHAESRRIFHLDGVISDTLGDDPCRASNVLAPVTAIGLAPLI
jgi:hypothetical protein